MLTCNSVCQKRKAYKNQKHSKIKLMFSAVGIKEKVIENVLTVRIFTREFAHRVRAVCDRVACIYKKTGFISSTRPNPMLKHRRDTSNV